MSQPKAATVWCDLCEGPRLQSAFQLVGKMVPPSWVPLRCKCRICCVQIGTHLPVFTMQQNTSAVAPCTPSVRCSPQYAQVAAGVVAIYVVNLPTRTVGLCSGKSSFAMLAPVMCVLIIHNLYRGVTSCKPCCRI